MDPYSVLGVSSESTQDDVRKSYKKQCLRYHPDKNVGKSAREREKCEEAFKRVQRANDLIGDAESRKSYERSLISPLGGMGGAGGSYGQDHPYAGMSPEDLFREFYGRQAAGRSGGGGFYRPRRRRSPFYFNGIDISDLFPGAGGRGFGFGGLSDPSANAGPKSIFVQHVTIPLSELYTGVEAKEFTLSDSVWQRYRAAFRGGIAKPMALQAFIMSAGLLLRTSWPVSLACFAASFHLSLPRPTRLFYHTDVMKGWKGGTKVTFSGAEPGVDVVFVIGEGEHDRFTRDGDDLETIATISRSTARKGGSIMIKPLGEGELPVLFKIKPGEIEGDGQVRTITGRGWPRRRALGPGEAPRGNLRVVFRIKADKKKRKHDAEEEAREEQGRKRGKKSKRR